MKKAITWEKLLSFGQFIKPFVTLAPCSVLILKWSPFLKNYKKLREYNALKNYKKLRECNATLQQHGLQMDN